MVIVDKKFISLSDLSKISGYTRDHLGLLIRKGLLSGVKVGKNYLCDIDSFHKYLLSDRCGKLSSQEKKLIISRLKDFSKTSGGESKLTTKSAVPTMVFGWKIRFLFVVVMILIFSASFLLFYKKSDGNYADKFNDEYSSTNKAFNLDEQNYYPINIVIK